MKNTRIIAAVLASLSLTCCTVSSESTPAAYSSVTDSRVQQAVADDMAAGQPTPTDINFSLERYNLIRRAYWVNGQREKAASVVCRVEKPLGYIVLFAGNAVVGSFVVDGKVSSLNSFLTPDSEYYELVGTGGGELRDYEPNKWIADVDGTYGENDSGIFFFTPDGKYIEWTGDYLYSDIPFEVEDPVVTYKGE